MIWAEVKCLTDWATQAPLRFFLHSFLKSRNKQGYGIEKGFFMLETVRNNQHIKSWVQILTPPLVMPSESPLNSSIISVIPNSEVVGKILWHRKLSVCGNKRGYFVWWLFMCVFDWATEYPEIWSRSGVSERIFLDEISIWNSRLNKAPWCGWALSSQLKAWIEQKDCPSSQ